MHKFKTLYISYDGMTDPLGQSQVLPYLLGLSKFDIEIHLISFEKQERFDNKSDDIKGLIANTSIIWHPLKYHQRPPVFSTLYDIWQLNRKAKEITKNHLISIVHCRSYISSLIGLSLKRRKGIPFLFDMRGFWADERIDGHIWNLKNPLFRIIYSFFKQKEKQFICESDFIISLTENAKNEILSWPEIKIREDKIQVIPCCADLDHFSLYNIDKLKLNNFQSTLNISNDDFVVSYIGSLGTWYMIDEMMEFFKTLQDKMPNSMFLVVTADNPEIAYAAAKKNNIPVHTIIVKKAERKEVPYLIALSKLSVFFIKPSYSKKASSPTKLAEILGMGIPVVCNSNVGDVESIVKGGKVGFVVNLFNKEQYKNVIDEMLDSLPIDPLKISNYAKKYASLEDGIKKYRTVYSEIFKAKDGDKIPL